MLFEYSTKSEIKQAFIFGLVLVLCCLFLAVVIVAEVFIYNPVPAEHRMAHNYIASAGLLSFAVCAFAFAMYLIINLYKAGRAWFQINK